jgi:hypothetical protein
VTFYIRKDRKTGGFVIVRVGGEYDQHAHIKSMDGCHQVIRLIDMGLEPKSAFLAQAVRRLLNDEEYAALKKCKEKYRNTPRH